MQRAEIFGGKFAAVPAGKRKQNEKRSAAGEKSRVFTQKTGENQRKKGAKYAENN